MSQAASFAAPSVVALNRILAERQGPDHRLRVSLTASYTVFLGGFLVAAIAGDGKYQEFGAPTSTGILAVTPIYSPGAPPGPRPVAKPVPPPEPRPETTSATPPPAVVARPPDDADLLREAPVKPRPATRKETAPAGKEKPQPAAADPTPGGGTLPSTSGPPGSPTGTLSGDGDGGFTALLFGNQWYAGRIRDLVYQNWGDPFLGADRPVGDLGVVVGFLIEKSGRVGAAEVEQSSGNAAWDRAGLRAVENSKLPPLPEDYPGSRLKVHFRFAMGTP